jgi:hypothetical protein
MRAVVAVIVMAAMATGCKNEAPEPYEDVRPYSGRRRSVALEPIPRLTLGNALAA